MAIAYIFLTAMISRLHEICTNITIFYFLPNVNEYLHRQPLESELNWKAFLNRPVATRIVKDEQIGNHVLEISLVGTFLTNPSL